MSFDQIINDMIDYRHQWHSSNEKSLHIATFQIHHNWYYEKAQIWHQSE